MTSSPPHLQDRFHALEQTITAPRFLACEGIGNEVPFFIFAYAPAEEAPTSMEIRNLVSRLSAKGLNILHIDLYDEIVAIIQERGKWDRLLAAEKSMRKDKFKAQLQNLTDVETKLIPRLAEKLQTEGLPQLLILTGVGLVYPYLRAHNILNNLQKVAKSFPTLLFFPGEYTHTDGTGQSLDLFGDMNEDKYYRAINIENF